MVTSGLYLRHLTGAAISMFVTVIHADSFCFENESPHNGKRALFEMTLATWTTLPASAVERGGRVAGYVNRVVVCRLAAGHR